VSLRKIFRGSPKKKSRREFRLKKELKFDSGRGEAAFSPEKRLITYKSGQIWTTVQVKLRESAGLREGTLYFFRSFFEGKPGRESHKTGRN